MTFGTLYLIPVTLGSDNIGLVIPTDVAVLARQLDYFVVENEKSARHFLGLVKHAKPIRDLHFSTLNTHTEDKLIPDLLKPLITGHSVGLMSEAGCPAIADPGAKLVALAHQKGIKVAPLVGPSAILMALMASGMSGQSFTFLGYLPVDKEARVKKLKELEKQSRSHEQTQIFIETPYRNMQMLESILSHCQASTRLCIACHVSLEDEFIATKTISDWKKHPLPELNKKPTVFLLYATM